MYSLVLIVILDMLHSSTSLSISVFPSTEVWEGDNIRLECGAEGEVGFIWVREQFSGERELLAHDQKVLIDDERVHVEKKIKQIHTVSRLLVS
jgi:hypothetical protein